MIFLSWPLASLGYSKWLQELFHVLPPNNDVIIVSANNDGTEGGDSYKRQQMLFDFVSLVRGV